MVARRDRDDGRKGGGIIVYALLEIAAWVTLFEKSEDAERLWLIVHADTGPYRIGLWYQPPDLGELATIAT